MFYLLLISVTAIKFALNVPTSGTEYKFCLSEYVADSTKVVGKFVIKNQPEQQITLKVFDSPVQPFEDKDNPEVHDNVYYSKNSLPNDGTFTFTTHKFANILFCFINFYQGNSQNRGSLHTPVEFSMTTGMDIHESFADREAKDKLKPMEADLQRISQVANEIVEQLEDLKAKEIYLRDVNEDALARVTSYSLFSIGVLFAVGIWQVYYLRAFFQSKRMI